MTLTASQFALNPLQYLASPTGWLDFESAPPLRERLETISAAGFTAIQSDVPAEMTGTEFAQLLSEYGMRPGPGYINLLWDEDPAVRARHIEDALAGTRTNLEAGEPLMFLSLGMDIDAPRVALPAVGHEADPRRMEAIVEYVGEVAAGVHAEGANATFHPHVGSWVETASEVRQVLDGTDPSVLGFGPDIGHLAWTGADPREIMTEYADRITGVHMKDIRLDVARQGREQGLSYQETALAGLWAEPGLGDLHPEDVLSVLPASFDGWVVVEVDRGTVPAPRSIEICGEWLAAHVGTATR